MNATNPERERLSAARRLPWRMWGAYLSERQWGTVREDYSPHGSAWDYFPHDHARSRAYRWGEDGIAGISDDRQRLCFSLAMWNGRDPILKERLFGLTGPEGNHGEDVKECYYYLDATPTHSYLKMLYKYPQAEFPYARLVEENRRRGKHQPEFEILDTGVFDDGRYFDVVVEYAKADRRICSFRSPRSTAVPTRRLSTCCRRSGFAIPGAGPQGRTSRSSAPPASADCSSSMTPSVATNCASTQTWRRRSCSSPTTKRTAEDFTARRPMGTSKTRSMTTSSTAITMR